MEVSRGDSDSLRSTLLDRRASSLRWLRSSPVCRYGVFCDSLRRALTGGQLGGNFMSWSSPIVLALLIIGTLGLAGFLVVEGKVSAVPIISLDVLRTRTVLCAFTANLFGAIVIFASIFQLPLYFLVVKNLSATQAGIHYFPMSVSLAVGSLVVGQIVNRTGRYRVALLFSNLLSLVTPLLVALAWRSDWPDSYWRYFTDLIPLGLGNGGAITIILVATIASVPHSNVATVTSINSFSRSVALLRRDISR